MALCNSCGEKILEDSDSCQHCGTSSGAEPAQLKYKRSTLDFTVTVIVVMFVSVVVFATLLNAFGALYGSNLRGAKYNNIARQDGTNMLSCLENHYADHQRYPRTLNELHRACSDLLRRNVVLNVTLLNQEDYEFVIFHKKGYKEYKMNSFSSRIKCREKGQKEWRDT